jgi:long-chain acyl-CoA synthetase
MSTKQIPDIAGESTLPRLLRRIAEALPDAPAQFTKDRREPKGVEGEFEPVSFSELYRQVTAVARGLSSIGVNRGDHVGLISENRQEWLVCDLAVVSLGAADVPRSCDATTGELEFILGFSECRLVIVEDGTQAGRVASLSGTLKDLETILVIDPAFDPADAGFDPPRKLSLVTYAELLEKGEAAENANDALDVEKEIDAGEENDVATIIFTSGTTGAPKGVMLSHGNFLHQVRHVPDLIEVGPGDRWLCVLPVWHSFERIMQYVAIGSASSLCYSKPKGPVLLADMAAVRPTWMASVPRIWEALMSGVYRNIRAKGGISFSLFTFFVAVGGAHASATDRVLGRKPRFSPRSRIVDFLAGIVPYLLLFPLRALGNVLVFAKIKEKLGGRFVAGISGGGALPEAVDTFFSAAGILLLEGYGLTESAPVLSFRPQNHPVPGTIGPIFPGTEYRIVDESGRIVPPGEQGILLAKGPQVMLGYYRKPELTREVLSEDGWLNTGDLAVATIDGELKIVGRAKDTIVLRGGENVEPLPIEQKLQESTYIQTAVAVGQDKKYIAALLVPDFESLETYAKEQGTVVGDRSELLASDRIQGLIQAEVSRLVSRDTGFKTFERIARFRLLEREFEVGGELSAKQEIKRHVIDEQYSREIEALFEA